MWRALFVSYEIYNKLLLLHPTTIFGCRKELQRSTSWIHSRQTTVTMQFFTSRWGTGRKVYVKSVINKSHSFWNLFIIHQAEVETRKIIYQGNHDRVWKPDLYRRRFLRFNFFHFLIFVKNSRTYWQTRRSSSKLLCCESYFQLSLPLSSRVWCIVFCENARW